MKICEQRLWINSPITRTPSIFQNVYVNGSTSRLHLAKLVSKTHRIQTLSIKTAYYLLHCFREEKNIARVDVNDYLLPFEIFQKHFIFATYQFFSCKGLMYGEKITNDGTVYKKLGNDPKRVIHYFWPFELRPLKISENSFLPHFELLSLVQY